MGYETAQDVEPFTEQEYSQAQEKLDTFYRSRRNVHLHICQNVKHPQGKTRECPPESIPFGFWDVCRFCRLWWRDGGEEK